ncbi:helix-turn-helix domain-containing protein [Algoriphagus terrigena]|uniref:helix-turn-helix domain-containing protein n=1 Tax=Algoriphagus terrigena TaxID=344884 RepID=UPI0006869EE5|nr:helix-turn-helix domain-containing protein [Algoriphagus terrigena]
METLFSTDFSPKNHFSIFPHRKPIAVHPLGSAYLDVDVGFNQPKRLQCYELYWIRRGSAPINIDTVTLGLRDGSVYCLSPGQVRQLEWDGGLEGFYISICPDFFNLLQNRFEVASVFDFAGEMREIEIKEGLEGELEQIIDKISREISACSAMQSDLLRAWLNIFMLYLTQCMSVSRADSSPTGDRDLLKRFLNLLPSHHSQKKMVSEYAEILCVTPNYLNSVVKKITGFPASHHIQQYLVMEAKRYAMYSQLRMKEIANRLGFVDYAHFSKYFKNYAGVNFSNYLKEINTTLA